MNHPQDLTLRQQADAVRRGDVSAKELLDATLERLRERDPAINATPVLFDELSQVQISQAPAGPLYGVPITVKDMFALPWRAARNGTMHNMIPAGASGPYRNLRDAGVIVVGIANQHELGMGTTGVYSAYGAMRNPWDIERCAGGSSGGSAAGVAARLVAGSLASDSGGSTRIPAAYCGVVGLKLTYGSVAYDGYFGAATTFSAPGVIARDAGDARSLTAALLQRPLPQQSGSGLRIGVVRDPFWNDADHETADVCQRALKLAGWKVTELKIENLELAVAAFLGRLIAEAGVPSPDVLASISAPTRALLLAGILAPARFVPRADRVRAAVRYSIAAAFDTVDFLAWPTSPAAAPTLEDTWIALPSGRKPVDVPNVRQSSIANLTGIPGISIPVGLNTSNLPLGLQLLGPWGSEARLLDAAEHIERVSEREFVNLVPPLAR
jgi:Asp-tRNA(Asn)/Glu-tRNA(Gln) amidotransferase A subunit family amidase